MKQKFAANIMSEILRTILKSKAHFQNIDTQKTMLHIDIPKHVCTHIWTIDNLKSVKYMILWLVL